MIILLYRYTLDTTTNHGDLSAGEVCASGSVDATNSTIKTGTLTLHDDGDIDANKVVIGFVENEDGTGDFSVAFNIKYHIR